MMKTIPGVQLAVFTRNRRIAFQLAQEVYRHLKNEEVVCWDGATSTLRIRRPMIGQEPSMKALPRTGPFPGLSPEIVYVVL